MSIFTWLDKKLSAVPELWINAFNDDKELSENNNEKALRMSEAVGVTRDAGLSMFFATVGVVFVAPLVLLSLPATWPLWITAGIALASVGLTEALLTLATTTYLNRNEISQRWSSEWKQSKGISGKIKAIAEITFNCAMTITGAMIWGLSAPIAKLGRVFQKELDAMLTYSMPGLVAVFRRQSKKIVKNNRQTLGTMTESVGNDSNKAQLIEQDIHYQKIEEKQLNKLMERPFDKSQIAPGKFYIERIQGDKENNISSTLITHGNKDIISHLSSNLTEGNAIVVSPSKYFEIVGYQELTINRLDRFEKKFKNDNAKYKTISGETGLKEGDVVVFYPKGMEGSHLDPTQCYFKHVDGNNQEEIKQFAKDHDSSFVCRVIPADKSGLNTQFTKLLKEGTLASEPKVAASIFAMLAVPGATWMAIGLAVGAAAGFLVGGPVGAIIGGIIGTWGIPALLTPLTGYVYYKAEGASNKFPALKDKILSLVSDKPKAEVKKDKENTEDKTAVKTSTYAQVTAQVNDPAWIKTKSANKESLAVVQDSPVTTPASKRSMTLAAHRNEQPVESGKGDRSNPSSSFKLT